MFEAIKDIFRRRSLKKHASTVPTGIIPVRDIRSAVAFIDVEDTSFDDCKLLIQSFFRDNNMKGEIFFFDFRKLGDGERLITSITTTVLKKDLNWFGQPSKEKIDILLAGEPDLFISLINRTDFPIQFMATASHAKFKIGRKQLDGNVFDMVISDPSDRSLSQAELFMAVKNYLSKIS